MPALCPSRSVFFVNLPKFGRRLHRYADCPAEQRIERFEPEDLA